MVFQSYALYPTMTVYDNLAFGLRIAGFDEDEIEDIDEEDHHVCLLFICLSPFVLQQKIGDVDDFDAVVVADGESIFADYILMIVILDVH